MVAIRVESPPGGRTPLDPAHGQKRIFEAAVARDLVQRILGPEVSVELRDQGGDRLAPLEREEADLAMVVVAPGGSERAMLSDAYARGGIVLAVPEASTVSDLSGLGGEIIAVAMDELGAPQVAQAALRERGVAATLQTVMGVSGAADAVNTGRAAALIGDRIGVEVLIRQQPGTLRIIGELAPRSYVVAMGRAATELQAAVNAALRDLAASGGLERHAAAAGFPLRAPER